MPGAIAGTDRFYSRGVIARSVPSRREAAVRGFGVSGARRAMGRRTETVRTPRAEPRVGAQPMGARVFILR